MSNKEITRESYQLTANAFANNVANLAPIESIETMMKLLPKQPKILDIGCGSGRDAKLFSDRGAHVVGIDFSHNMLKIAKSHAPNAEFQLMDIEFMNFPDNSFDGAWAACSLIHIPKSNFARVLEKINQLLKPNGYLYLALKEGQGESLLKDERYEGDIQKFWSFFQEEELKQALINAKFSILECELVEKTHNYQTQSAFKVFCQKK